MRPNHRHEVIDLGEQFVIQMGDGTFYAETTTYTIQTTQNVADAATFRSVTDAVTRIETMTRCFDVSGGINRPDPLT